MRHKFLALVYLTLAFAGSARADDPTSLLNKKELVATQQPMILVPAPSLSGAATREYGPQYQSVVPVEIKSDTPGINRTWDPNAHPGNASHLTPEGMACAADADCIEPLGCYKRADSSKIPERLCAIPPGQ